MLRLGIALDLRNPARYRRDPVELYRCALRLCEEADDLGIDMVWVSEHHGFADGYLPQPLTFLAAVAARTRRLRIASGVTVAPLRPAALVAEEAAVVDLLSGGRLELGLGAGYVESEFAIYGAPGFRRRHRLTDACVGQIRRLWAEGVVTPAPVQPSVPIWLGYQSPAGAKRAGLLGTGLLSARRDLIGPYRRALSEARHPADSARMGGFLNMWITEDPERDWPVVAEHLSAQWSGYPRHASGQRPTPADGPDAWRQRGLGAERGHLLVATPEVAAGQLADYVRGTPIDTVFTFAMLPGMPPELGRTHVRILGTELLPRVRALLS